jgi:hypothetical protein
MDCTKLLPVTFTLVFWLDFQSCEPCTTVPATTVSLLKTQFMLPNPHSARSYIILRIFLPFQSQITSPLRLSPSMREIYRLVWNVMMWFTGPFMIEMSANFPRLRYEVVYCGPLLCDE